MGDRSARSRRSDVDRQDALRTVAYVAEKLFCSKDLIMDLITDGDLKYVDIARSGSKQREIRFTDERIEQFKTERTRPRYPVSHHQRLMATLQYR
jgi:hypothetical protein